MVISPYTARKVSENKSWVVEWWMKITIIWNVLLYRMAETYQRFRRNCWLSLQGRRAMVERADCSQMVGTFYQTSQHHISEDSNLRIHCHDNLRSLTEWCIFQRHSLQFLDLWLICWKIWSVTIIFQSIGADIICSFCVVKLLMMFK